MGAAYLASPFALPFGVIIVASAISFPSVVLLEAPDQMRVGETQQVFMLCAFN